MEPPSGSETSDDLLSRSMSMLSEMTQFLQELQDGADDKSYDPASPLQQVQRRKCSHLVTEASRLLGSHATYRSALIAANSCKRNSNTAATTPNNTNNNNNTAVTTPNPLITSLGSNVDATKEWSQKDVDSSYDNVRPFLRSRSRGEMSEEEVYEFMRPRPDAPHTTFTAEMLATTAAPASPAENALDASLLRTALLAAREVSESASLSSREVSDGSPEVIYDTGDWPDPDPSQSPPSVFPPDKEPRASDDVVIAGDEVVRAGANRLSVVSQCQYALLTAAAAVGKPPPPGRRSPSASSSVTSLGGRTASPVPPTAPLSPGRVRKTKPDEPLPQHADLMPNRKRASEPVEPLIRPRLQSQATYVNTRQSAPATAPAYSPHPPALPPPNSNPDNDFYYTAATAATPAAATPAAAGKGSDNRPFSIGSIQELKPSVRSKQHLAVPAKQHPAAKHSTLKLQAASAFMVPDIKGWLDKKGGIARNKWQRRFAICEAGVLYFYKNPKDRRPTLRLRLRHYDIVDGSPGGGNVEQQQEPQQQEPQQQQHKQPRFQLRPVSSDATKNGKAYTLRTAEAADHDVWTQVLRRASAGLAVPDPEDDSVDEWSTDDDRDDAFTRSCDVSGDQMMSSPVLRRRCLSEDDALCDWRSELDFPAPPPPDEMMPGDYGDVVITTATQGPDSALSSSLALQHISEMAARLKHRFPERSPSPNPPASAGVAVGTPPAVAKRPIKPPPWRPKASTRRLPPGSRHSATAAASNDDDDEEEDDDNSSTLTRESLSSPQPQDDNSHDKPTPALSASPRPRGMQQTPSHSLESASSPSHPTASSRSGADADADIEPTAPKRSSSQSQPSRKPAASATAAASAAAASAAAASAAAAAAAAASAAAAAAARVSIRQQSSSLVSDAATHTATPASPQSHNAAAAATDLAHTQTHSTVANAARAPCDENGHGDDVAFAAAMDEPNRGPPLSSVYVALYDFTARDEQELSFARGDLVLVTDRTQHTDWWLAVRNTAAAAMSSSGAGDDMDFGGSPGLVPVTYVMPAFEQV